MQLSLRKQNTGEVDLTNTVIIMPTSNHEVTNTITWLPSGKKTVVCKLVQHQNDKDVQM
jgi:hypothetical protein